MSEERDKGRKQQADAAASRQPGFAAANTQRADLTPETLIALPHEE
jgi:hypothetical protein